MKKVIQAPDYGYNGLKYVKAKDNFDRSNQPPSGANPVIKVPAFWTKDLGNGIKAIGTENTELPLVTFVDKSTWWPFDAGEQS